jgi:ubiquinol-cytochrome c reductase cytochrome b subunit
MEPNRFGLLFIAGPWFFLGLQELLRYWPAFIAGVIAPLLPLALLFWLPHSPRPRGLVLGLIGLWLLAYAGLTVLCLQRI